MPVLTCSDMVAQCLQGQPPAWKHFIAEYLPFAAAVLERHLPAPSVRRDELLRELLLAAQDPDARFFRDYSGQSEREFLLHLREHVLRVAGRQQPAAPAPEIPLDWEVFDGALSGFTALERQTIWMFLLEPEAGDTDQILRLDAKTVAGAMAKAQEALRVSSDRWNPEALARNRHRLAAEARDRRTQDCPPPRMSLRLLDGQITWSDRTEIEYHLTACWPCVDLLCRFREITFLTRRMQPLSESEAAGYLKLLGLEAAGPSRWKRLLGKK